MDEITIKCAASGYPAWQQWYILSNVNKTNGPNVGIYSTWPTVNKSSYRNVKYRLEISPTVTQADKEIRNLNADDKNRKKTRGKWIRGRRKRGNRTILDISPLSSSFFLHPPPFLLTRIMFHFRCGLSPRFWLVSGPLSVFSLFLSVPWCQLVWCRCSWTPPLTDNSLDGTLLRTAQCTAILPVSTRFVVDGDDHPLHSEWYFPDGEGGGGELWGKLFFTGWTVPLKCMQN